MRRKRVKEYKLTANKAQSRGGNIPRKNTPFNQAIVFTVGGGNYVEYQNLMDYAKVNKSIQSHHTTTTRLTPSHTTPHHHYVITTSSPIKISSILCTTNVCYFRRCNQLRRSYTGPRRCSHLTTSCNNFQPSAKNNSFYLVVKII